MLSRSRSSNIAMGAPSFHDLKKQASFFFKEKLKTARLALTHVTPLQLMTEEATDGNTWTPNTQTLGSISKAAFEFEHYSRIVDVLHNRFAKFEKRSWRTAYNSLIVLEHLLTHGPESVSEEFQCDRDVISQMETFQHIDEKGFNWGLAVRKKSEKVLKLLEKGGALLKEERKRARELSRGIQGFGSFNHKSSSSSSWPEKGVLQESPVYRKYNSRFEEQNKVGDNITNVTQEEEMGESTRVKPQTQEEKPKAGSSEESRSLKENVAPEEETDPLLGSNTKEEGCYSYSAGGGQEEDERHPFTEGENKQTVASLLGD
ncbi:PREDICTED: epsin-3 [Tarenaya hassleriana]|uniref:epsin-3 n=1 Tax=Tarenaya hassleriana TaxID=28532 RepID=UPI00053C4C9A|nr:PREDICTED: epsin-3 [Tarenaya hassleriana]